MAEAALQYGEPRWRIRWRLARRGLLANWAIFRENKIGILGLGIILFFALLALLHPLLMATVWDKRIYDPIVGYDVNVSPPSWAHPLGTDRLGRDVLSQLMYSTGSEFLLGVLAALITVFIGTIVGAVAAYYGGWIDALFMRLADVLLLFPFIAFLIVISAFIDLDLLTLALVLGILGGFGGITIILKAQALQVKVKPFVEAAKVAGGSSFHIIFTHIIPNVLPLSFLYMMFNVTGAIFSEAVLSFFGLLNVRMSWGIMIFTARSSGDSIFDHWWLFVPAGLAITLLCAAFYLVGRGMDEIVNPRLRKR